MPAVNEPCMLPAVHHATLLKHISSRSARHAGRTRGKVIADHQPPSRMIKFAQNAPGIRGFLYRCWPNALKQEFYPHCGACSHRQAAYMAGRHGTIMSKPVLVMHRCAHKCVTACFSAACKQSKSGLFVLFASAGQVCNALEAPALIPYAMHASSTCKM